MFSFYLFGLRFSEKYPKKIVTTLTSLSFNSNSSFKNYDVVRKRSYSPRIDKKRTGILSKTESEYQNLLINILIRIARLKSFERFCHDEKMKSMIYQISQGLVAIKVCKNNFDFGFSKTKSINIK